MSRSPDEPSPREPIQLVPETDRYGWVVARREDDGTYATPLTRVGPVASGTLREVDR